MTDNMIQRQLGVIRRVVSERFPQVLSVNTAPLRDMLIENMSRRGIGRRQEDIIASIDDMYLPLYEYISAVMAQDDLCNKKPLFIGISAPQGAGTNRKHYL